MLPRPTCKNVANFARSSAVRCCFRDIFAAVLVSNSLDRSGMSRDAGSRRRRAGTCKNVTKHAARGPRHSLPSQGDPRRRVQMRAARQASHCVGAWTLPAPAGNAWARLQVSEPDLQKCRNFARILAVRRGSRDIFARVFLVARPTLSRQVARRRKMPPPGIQLQKWPKFSEVATFLRLPVVSALRLMYATTLARVFFPHFLRSVTTRVPVVSTHVMRRQNNSTSRSANERRWK